MYSEHNVWFGDDRKCTTVRVWLQIPTANV